MPDLELASSPLRTLLPPYRFVRTEETIIHRAHPQHAPLSAAPIRVLNWNIAKNNHHSAWLRDFAEILECYQPNLIFLQEVRMCAEAKQLEELAELGWSFAPNFMDAHHNIYAGVATASKAACVNRRVMITRHHEPVTKTPKVSLCNEYPLGTRDSTLLAINTHLINFVDSGKFKAQLYDLEKAIAAHSGAVIFSGDFNTWNRSRWLLLSQMIRRLGLTRATFSDQEAQKIKRFLLSPPLDHIFYRGLTQTPLQAKVLDHITSSDHKPMMVEFAVG